MQDACVSEEGDAIWKRWLIRGVLAFPEKQTDFKRFLKIAKFRFLLTNSNPYAWVLPERSPDWHLRLYQWYAILKAHFGPNKGLFCFVLNTLEHGKLTRILFSETKMNFQSVVSQVPLKPWKKNGRTEWKVTFFFKQKIIET